MEFSTATMRILPQNLSVCEHTLAERKRKARQATLDSFFAKRITIPA
jgi:hypothetical protein